MAGVAGDNRRFKAHGNGGNQARESEILFSLEVPRRVAGHDQIETLEILGQNVRVQGGWPSF